MERLDSLSPDELIQIILDQQRLIEQLRAEIEQLKRRGSAAPFSKGNHKPNPKRAGLGSLVWMVLRATKVLPGAPTPAEVFIVGAI